jgi:hypothetical protein
MQGREWSNIVEFYRSIDSSDTLLMAKLVEEIAASSYGQKLYAATSMSTLHISQHQKFEHNNNVLIIDFVKGYFKFTYKESPFVSKDWEKECGRNDGFKTFEHVIGCLKWFLPNN